MSEIENIIPCLESNNLDEVFFYLFEHFERNEIAELSKDEEELLTDVVEKMELIFFDRKVSFNKESFIVLIKRLYPNSIMLGGNGEIEDYTTSPRKSMIFTIYDFTAILAFIVSIYLLYLSFIQFNQLTCNITGNNIVELSVELKEQLNIAIQSLTGQEFSFLSYIYNIFTTFSSNIVSGQQQRISSIVRAILSSSIPDFTSQVTSQCITNETGWTGFFEATARTFTSPEATTNCVTSMTQTLITGFLNRQQQQINLLLTGIQTNSLQIQNLVVYGVRLGYASAGYLTYRLMQIRRRIENNNQFTNIQGGGIRKRMTRKYRKGRKLRKGRKSKKARRKSRKN